MANVDNLTRSGTGGGIGGAKMMRTKSNEQNATNIENNVEDFVCVIASILRRMKFIRGTKGSLCCTSARIANRISKMCQRQVMSAGQRVSQLFGFSSAGEGALKLRIISSGVASGSGDLSFIGESVPGGSGMFAAIVISGSPSSASWYSGLVCLDREGLVDGCRWNLLEYGSCLNHELAFDVLILNPGGDHGAPVLDRSSISLPSCSDLKPECCEGISNNGERLSCSSKSSSEAASEG